MAGSLLVICGFLFGVLHRGEGGSCWDLVGETGRCNQYIASGMTKQECCNQRHGMGWTPEDSYSEGRLFFLQYLGQGARECSPCERTCDDIGCSPGESCRMRNGMPECYCNPDCSAPGMRQGAVCGTDGRSYRSQCALLERNCRRRLTVEVEYHSRCKYSCNQVLCGSGKSCMMDQNGIPHCIGCNAGMMCSTPTSTRAQLCGGNGITYPSFCHFRRATCLGGQSIGVAYNRACDESLTCDTLTCADNKQCLTDPRTGKPHCITCSQCPGITGSNKICATDGNTYDSYCDMLTHGCNNGILLLTSHYGECQSAPLGDVDFFNSETD